MNDAIVVGAGLFGSIIAKELREKGRKVLAIDAENPCAASKAAACLMKPNWFSTLGQSITRPSLELLDRLYGIEEIPFRLRFGGVSVYGIDPHKILLKDYVKAKVSSVEPVDGGWAVHCGKTTVFHARQVIVAAGVWTPLLVPVEGGIEGRAGVAFLWPQRRVDPFINCWMPHRQVVAFNRSDGLWITDNSSLQYFRSIDSAAQQKLLQSEGRYISKSPEEAALWVEACFSRCVTALGGDASGPFRQLFGVRAYSKKKPFVFEETSPGLWVATGGAHYGTIAAGWCAHEFEKRTQ